MMREARKKLFCLLLLLWFAGTGSAFAQGAPGGPVFWMATYAFPETDSTCLVEVFYSITRASLEYRNRQGFLSASATIDQAILRGDSVIFRSSLSIRDTVSSAAEIKGGQRILEFRRFRVRVSRYAFSATLQDANSGLSRTIVDTVDARPYRKNELVGSDLILTSRLASAPEPTSAYWRNGLEVVPNVSRVYGTGLERLGFYGEVYGLRKRSDGLACYSMDVRVNDAYGSTPVRYSGRSHLVEGTSCAIHGALDLSEFTGGTYLLTVTVHDCVTGDSLEFHSYFHVVRPRVAATSGTAQSVGSSQASEYATMNEAQLDSVFRLVRYIATNEERDVYEHLDLDGKRRFLDSFWLRRDPDATTPENEAKLDYLRRVAYANAHFSYGKREGWRTDRGRVLLQYGWPDQVDREVGEMIENPYEIWTYQNVQGGVIFVFVDRRRTGEYELVHSTARGEIRSEDWSQYLYR